MKAEQYIWLFQKSLRQLREELSACSDETTVWSVPTGIKNPAGHLSQHLVGSLKNIYREAIRRVGICP